MVEQRAQFVETLATIDPERLVFLDESGAHIAMTRDYARAPRGQRVVGKVPRNRGTVLTMLGAIALDGVRALMTREGATSGDVFETYVRDHLIPSLNPGDVVVMDNLAAHHRRGVRELIEQAGSAVLFMPPYSPDLNPIELCWSKVKAVLKKISARTRPALESAVLAAVGAVSSSDTYGWFVHTGIDAHQLK